MVVKIYIENTGKIFGKDMPEALNRLDSMMREKFNDSVPQALARANGHSPHNGNRRHSQSHRQTRAGDIDPTFRRLFSRRRRG